MLRDNYWYKMLTQANVDLVTDPIERITADGVITRSGETWPADVLVLATGFEAQTNVWRRWTSKDAADRRSAGCGATIIPEPIWEITIPAFPNLFMIYGPGTEPRAWRECDFITRSARCVTSCECLRELLETGARAMEVQTGSA